MVKCNLQQQTTKGNIMKNSYMPEPDQPGDWLKITLLLSVMWLLSMAPAAILVAYGMPVWIAGAWGGYSAIKTVGMLNHGK
jgi:hypothetical protein